MHQIRAQPRQQRIEIGGDFDEAETLAWVSKYFGSILRGPDVAMPDKPAVTLDADRYLSLEDNVALPLMQIAFPTVHRFHPDEAPLDVLMYVLGVGETSLLYKNMVSNRLAVQAQANHGCRELSCTFAVIALPNPTAGHRRGQFRLRPELTLFLRIDNLTDAVYDSALGYPGLPRAFVAGGRFDIGG